MSYDAFMQSTPKVIKLTIDAYWENQKKSWEKIEYQSWLNGYYVMNAVGANFSRRVKYPENPLKKEAVVVEDMELSEEEKTYYTEKLFERLQRMKDRNDRYKARQGKQGS